MSWLALAQLSAMTFILVGGIIAITLRLLYPRLVPYLRRIHPYRRVTILTALGVAPLAGALLILVVSFLPGVLGALVPALDHCFALPDPGAHTEHPHLCAAHLPARSASMMGFALLLPFIGGISFRFTRLLASTIEQYRLLRSLVRSSTATGEEHRIVESENVFALSTVVESHILLSRGLVERITPTIQRTVIAHERAHLARRDAQRSLITSVLTLLHMPSIRNSILRELDFAMEQAADETAASELGSRSRVALALVTIERLRAEINTGSTPVIASLGANGFAESEIASRVHALLSPPKSTATTFERRLALGLMAICVFAMQPIHHAAEHLAFLFL